MHMRAGVSEPITGKHQNAHYSIRGPARIGKSQSKMPNTPLSTLGWARGLVVGVLDL